MKKLIFLLFVSFSSNAYAQDADKSVTLTVTGQGKTIDEAKTNALRSAIEQAFGTFISSNTTIMDDKLVKDEIVSVTNGNIQKYEVLNETPLLDGRYATTLKAIVSVSKLTTFCESKGIKVEFKGGLFAMNIAIQELNEKSELIAWKNTKKIIDELIPKCFDYEIKVEEPVFFKDTKYKIATSVNVVMNKNYTILTELLLNFCKSVSMSNEEKDYYLSHGKLAYELLLDSSNIYSAAILKSNSSMNKFDNLNFLTRACFRNLKIYDQIANLPWEMASKCLVNFQINNGIDTFSLEKFVKRELYYNPEYRANGQTLSLIHKKGDFSFDWLIDFKKDWFTQNVLDENPSSNYQITNGSQSSDHYILYDNGTEKAESYFYVSGFGKVKKFNNILNKLALNIDYSYFQADKKDYTCLMLHNLIDFMVIKFDDLRDIAEIKKISEYKIEVIDLQDAKVDELTND